uniref:Protein NEDD1 n=1 Tax=Anthurium amnicola TaxID=1678845 RepID=A0A1D1ZM28_9ARAE
MGAMGGASLADPLAALLATCGGDTVKLFDLTVDSGDPCVLSYTPTPGSHVNSVKWNHTNLVVASAGEDKKISLWRKNGQNIGMVPLAGNDAGDNINESISTISFSNKGSRYLCSGGSSHIVRIWDLQRKRCIKWLSGHTDTITGVMYNCKDEHLASISLKGDIILHNLASGARAAELKDPNGQVLRMLDYSRLSRHILVTAGDDGSIHLWDTTARSPKISWLKQHSAPMTGVCFSPSNDKIIATVGLDKKLYTFDSGNRRPTSCIPHEAPFSSLAFRDDGFILAAGTNTGRVVFYDVRGKPQPLTVLRAYNSSEAVTCLCWQRSKPVVVNENCTSEIALLGGTGEDSVLMPDPLPSTSSSSFSATAATFPRGSSTSTSSGSLSTAAYLPTAEETPIRSQLWPGGSLSKLQAPRNNFNLKDDMDVFSPLVDVQPITPSLGNWWDDHDEFKKDNLAGEKKSMLLPPSFRRFPHSEGNSDTHPISDWRSDSSSGQEDAPSNVSQLGDKPVAFMKSELSSTTSETWGGNVLADKLTSLRQPVALSRFLPIGSLSSGSVFAGSQDSSLPSSFSAKSSLAGSGFSSSNLQSNPPGILESSSGLRLCSVATSLGAKTQTTQANLDIPGTLSSVLPRRFSTHTERVSTSIGDGSCSAAGSPKSKKTGAETREELLNSLLSRHDSSSAAGTGSLPTINGVPVQSQAGIAPSADQLQGASSFSLQLVQRTLEESLGSVQMSIHEDVRNVHIELLRQFHMQEMEMANLMNSVLEKLDDLQKEVQFLRRENQQLRMLL